MDRVAKAVRDAAGLLAWTPSHRPLRALKVGDCLGRRWYRLKSSGPAGPFHWRGCADVASSEGWTKRDPSVLGCGLTKIVVVERTGSVVIRFAQSAKGVIPSRGWRIGNGMHQHRWVPRRTSRRSGRLRRQRPRTDRAVRQIAAGVRGTVRRTAVRDPFARYDRTVSSQSSTRRRWRACSLVGCVAWPQPRTKVWSQSTAKPSDERSTRPTAERSSRWSVRGAQQTTSSWVRSGRPRIRTRSKRSRVCSTFFRSRAVW